MLKCVICPNELQYSGRGRKPKYCSNACKMRDRRAKQQIEKSNDKKTLNKKMMMAIKSPAIRYYGGKFNLASWIIEHFPAHECYVEPFGGAANVLLCKPVSAHEAYNDLNGDVVNFFEMLRTRRDELLEQLLFTPYAEDEHAQAWDYHPDSLERARRFYIRSWASFGSGTDKNAKSAGFRITKQGRSSAISTFNHLDSLITAAARLSHVYIMNNTAERVIERFDTPSTLFYVDPPYTHDTRENTTGYSHEMDDASHRRLAEQLHSADGMIVLSGYSSPMYESLYAGWHKVERKTRDLVANEQTECLWLSPGVYEKVKLPLFA